MESVTNEGWFVGQAAVCYGIAVKWVRFVFFRGRGGGLMAFL